MKRQWLCSPMAILIAASFAASCAAQERAAANTNAEDARYAQLSAKLDQVLAVLGDTQRELAESRQQMHELEMKMQAIDTQSSKGEAPVSSEGDNRDVANLQAAVRQLGENTEILQAEVKQHDQTKVESSSKYPIKISGMLLSTTNLIDGAVDNVDLPVVALQRNGSVSHGSLATTWRQTLLGLDAEGPTFWGARSAADIRVDFFGQQPTGTVGYDTNAGTLRLRTAHVHVDWPNSSLTASLDSPLISPYDPTSYMSIGEPSMAWSGNLWTWSPQIEFKHLIPSSATGRVGFEAGLIDPAATASYFNTGLQANPSESSKQPGYETRVSYALGSGDRPLIVGASGYYAFEKYPYHQQIDSWAGTADWKLPLNKRLELSGELYRGRALGQLGGGAFKDFVPYGTGHQVRGLDAEGGWTQLKARISTLIEINAAIGQDSAFAGQVRQGATGGTGSTSTLYPNLTANRTLMGNIVFRPRTYLLFSLEYRKIETWQVMPPADKAQPLGLAIGYLF
jgi:hypothetical protein